MILYVNGDSHSAGAEAVNNFAFAEDDPLYYALGRIPHPDNERVSYGCMLANIFGAILHCDAESASSNDRIIRTTYEYLEQNTPDFVVIGWSTWEREEWLYNNIYYQVTAGGTDIVPSELEQQYKEWVISRAPNHSYSEQAQGKIWQLHQTLESKNIPHVFFNTFSCLHAQERKDWQGCYLAPYEQTQTYYDWCLSQGFTPTKGYHFGPDAHAAWANRLTNFINESIITK